MLQIRQTEVFFRWLADLTDRGQSANPGALGIGPTRNLGDSASVGGGVHEFRVHIGPGYRIYFAQRRKVVVILLCAGDKSTQSRDIARAKRLLHEIEAE
ncbi:MAG: type II toxin-antitoxin system RelE/ParE family toxin [Gammaproteobacteria bacterium]|nr:type II toxin-antitoxin system RelE/ParE family toxin [Gammaproteobacteria bacterium]